MNTISENGPVSEMVFVAAWIDSLNTGLSDIIHTDSAPTETAEFGFLIGEWSGRGLILRPDGRHLAINLSLSGKYILDGWAIQDDLCILSENGRELSRTTSIRTYSSDERSWKIAEISRPSNLLNQLSAERVGDSMVVHGRKNTPSGPLCVRSVFHDIYSDSFRCRIEISDDDGKSWSCNGAIIEMKRSV